MISRMYIKMHPGTERVKSGHSFFVFNQQVNVSEIHSSEEMKYNSEYQYTLYLPYFYLQFYSSSHLLINTLLLLEHFTRAMTQSSVCIHYLYLFIYLLFFFHCSITKQRVTPESRTVLRPSTSLPCHYYHSITVYLNGTCLSH